MTPTSAVPGSDLWISARQVYEALEEALGACRNELATAVENRAFTEADVLRNRTARINSLQVGLRDALLLARRDQAGARAAIERIREDAGELGG
jgi:hypothetical protein